MRRITDLIDESYLHRRPRSVSGKSFSLHPTRKLVAEFEAYALQLKALVGQTFWFSSRGDGMEDFYFGGYYMASRILSYPAAMRMGVGFVKTVRILSPMDPTFKTLSDFSSNLNELCGTNIEVVTRPIDALHREIMDNHARGKSAYDLIAVDLPWIGQLASEGIIQPLDDIIAAERYASSDFHSAAWKGSAYGGRQFSLPVQPTPEVLFYRTDLFAEAGLGVPASTDDVLFAARTLYRSARDLSGIVMNFGRGIPVAHTFVQMLADFGQPVIDLTPLGSDFDTDTIESAHFRPMIDTEAGHACAKFLRELLDYSHRDSLKCNWDPQIAIFAAGQAAMCYGWTIRAAAIELDDTARAHGRFDCVAHPPGTGARAVSPIGGFSLALPAGLDAPGTARAWKVMEYLTRPEMMKWYVQNGNLTSPRFSTSADPEVQAMTRVISRVDAMEKRGELQIWPRPPVAEFQGILDVLGVEIHRMLTGDATIPEALAAAQNRVDGLMRAAGRY